MNTNNFPASVIPMVSETTLNGERVYDIYSMLLRNRIILVGDEINDRTANVAIAQILYLSREDPEEPISMYIHSPGGVVYSGLAIYDAMQAVPNPIATVSMGFTASFGTILLAGGSKGRRYALPNTTIHMHQPHGGAQGQASEIEIQAREILRLRSRINEIMAKNTGQTLEAIQRDMERDFFMTAEQAVEYGLVDHVMEQSRVDKIPELIRR